MTEKSNTNLPPVTPKEITDYFRSNIFEAFASYNAWKMITHSQSQGIVSEEMAKRYVEIQNYHANFFTCAQQAFLVDFVIMSLHSFDKKRIVFSFYKVDKSKTEEFIKNNYTILVRLRTLRNELLAHRAIKISSREIPSVNELDSFFKNLIEFYNKLTSTVDNSSTIFTNAETVKYDIENLFKNLYRGESARKREVNIRYLWEENHEKASDIL